MNIKAKSAAVLPNVLNGFKVIQSTDHGNGYHTVMVERPTAHEPYVIGTWYAECGARWQWGHYCETKGQAQDTMRNVGKRNAARPRIKS